MKPTWLIERGVYREHALDFRAEVQRQGMVCIEVDYRPGKHPPEDMVGSSALTDDACVVLWGTFPLMQQIQLRRQWVPGGWCNIRNLKCSNYYAYFDATIGQCKEILAKEENPKVRLRSVHCRQALGGMFDECSYGSNS